MALTEGQATRLFGIEAEHCREVLGTLVHAGFLATDGRRFLRAQ